MCSFIDRPLSVVAQHKQDGHNPNDGDTQSSGSLQSLKTLARGSDCCDYDRSATTPQSQSCPHQALELPLRGRLPPLAPTYVVARCGPPSFSALVCQQYTGFTPAALLTNTSFPHLNITSRAPLPLPSPSLPSLYPRLIRLLAPAHSAPLVNVWTGGNRRSDGLGAGLDQRRRGASNSGAASVVFEDSVGQDGLCGDADADAGAELAIGRGQAGREGCARRARGGGGASRTILYLPFLSMHMFFI
ncbi:hypothetical protein C8R47DRAFT_1073137 [Mycena vitilis]|nr:hypothetical protein C8R47DRAFT_1073137 [Mycena vitilis]